MADPLFIAVDLFCGAGGTTTGFVQATLHGVSIVLVIACVNHDPKAIKSHWRNHPGVKHFEEDIRTLDLTDLIKLVEYYRKKYPNAKLILWASLECTNFSKAKGGKSRDADSRTLADHLERYVTALIPDFIQIENVVEFMSWGPLDANGKPISRKNGQDWIRWRQEICNIGYYDEWRELNSANYGSYTSRNRLFGCFAKNGLSISWPEPTHAKSPPKFGIHGDLLKWRAVKDILNFADEGESIFIRKKPLSDKTLERIYAGLIKYIAKGDTSFISKYYSGKPEGKVITTNGPAGTICTVDTLALVNVDFLLKYNSTNKNGKHTPPSIEEPCPVVSTQGRLGVIRPEFSPTIQASRRQHYIVNPSHGGHSTSTDAPCPVVIARQDKAPLYLVQVENGPVAIAVFECDSEVMIRIKQFMAVYGLVDIKMRMLRVPELLRIQGFPADYILEGNQSDQKKFIGNSVVPHVVKVWAEAMGMKLIDDIKKKVCFTE